MISYESSISDNTNLSAYYNLPQLYKTMSAKGQMSTAQYYRKSQDLYDLLASRYKNDNNIVKDAILRKCNISKKMKNWSDLAESCDGYIDQFGMNDSAEVLYMLGQALVGKQQYAEAEDIFAECIDTAKEDTVLKGRVQLELESLKNLQ